MNKILTVNPEETVTLLSDSSYRNISGVPVVINDGYTGAYIIDPVPLSWAQAFLSVEKPRQTGPINYGSLGERLAAAAEVEKKLTKLTTTQSPTTLPTDSKTRKEYPISSGCIRYFPAALAGVAKTSKLGNDKHNPGEALHHARGKSMDHADCVIRHLIDLEDLMASASRSGMRMTKEDSEQILSEVNSLAWRALALSQELHEKYGGAPLAPGAKEPK